MFIGVVGSKCSGRSTVVDYLVSQQFIELTLSGSSRPTLESSTFPNSASLTDFVTRQWRANFVILLDASDPALDALSVRPFFLVVVIDAPLLTRWRRLLASVPAEEGLSLEQFAEIHDSYRSTRPKVGDGTTIISIHNDSQSKEALWQKISGLDLMNPEKLRPGWDSYFMTLANLASLRSNCMKRRVGAIIVRNRRIIATGYNGTPRNLKNCNEGGCSRCNAAGNIASGDECLCLHAEENALIEAGRERVGDEGVLYCNTCPCLRCSIKIVQTGVREVVYNLGYKMDDSTAQVFTQAGITLRQYSPPSLS